MAYQRRRIAELLVSHRRTERVSKIAYGRELRQSRVAMSPFGYSEINYKDFEVFLAGAVLLKPDMGHLDTWPDYYRPGETYVAHRWDLSDVESNVEIILSNPAWAQSIARAGQEAYRWHLREAEGRIAFADRFARIISP